MKTINVTFEDDEIKSLIKLKGERSWHDYIMHISVERRGKTK